jgi:hypothetical protein
MNAVLIDSRCGMQNPERIEKPKVKTAFSQPHRNRSTVDPSSSNRNFRFHPASRLDKPRGTLLVEAPASAGAAGLQSSRKAFELKMGFSPATAQRRY